MKLSNSAELKELRQIVGCNIKHFRIKRGFSLKDFSDLSRIGEKKINYFEAGKSFVRIETLQVIAHVLKTPLKQFFEER